MNNETKALIEKLFDGENFTEEIKEVKKAENKKILLKNILEELLDVLDELIKFFPKKTIFLFICSLLIRKAKKILEELKND